MLRRAHSPTTTANRLSRARLLNATRPFGMVSMPSFQTLLLSTDPSSISFPGGIESDLPPFITDPETERVIKLAASNIREGQLVAFPTETVYGLGANGLSGTAVERIYKAKGQ